MKYDGSKLPGVELLEIDGFRLLTEGVPIETMELYKSPLRLPYE